MVESPLSRFLLYEGFENLSGWTEKSDFMKKWDELIGSIKLRSNVSESRRINAMSVLIVKA